VPAPHHEPPPDDATAELDAPENADDSGKANGGVRRLNLVRGYVLLIVGVGLIIYSFVAGASVHAGALTLGGALIGFNPLFRATMSG